MGDRQRGGHVPSADICGEDRAAAQTGEGALTRAALRGPTLLVTSTLTVLAVSGVAAALPGLAAEFRDDPSSGVQVRLILTLPALFILLGAPIAGAVIDRYGRKRLLLAALVLYSIAGLSGIVARSLPELLLGRALLGVAVAGVMTSLTTLISDFYDGPERARMLGYQQATIGVGGALVLALGGLLTAFGPRAPFAMHVIALLLIPPVVAFISEPERRTVRAAPPALPAIALGWRILPWFALGFLVQVAYTIVPVQLPFYLPEVTGATAAESGLAIAGLVLFYALGALAAGAAVERARPATVLGGAFVGAGVCYLLIWRADGWPLIVAGLVFAGICFGFVLPTLNASVASVAPAELRGRVFGSFSTVMFVGQFVSPLVAQPAIALGASAVCSGLLAPDCSLSGRARGSWARARQRPSPQRRGGSVRRSVRRWRGREWSRRPGRSRQGASRARPGLGGQAAKPPPLACE
ncbi:MAG: hypothetical protein KatS3mg060_1081 [Dehalococcoidia bacterium]|nr:MAG: hypothetical protein KatS3mg060_1081 [Dehalococcoidia bacterium]